MSAPVLTWRSAPCREEGTFSTYTNLSKTFNKAWMFSSQIHPLHREELLLFRCHSCPWTPTLTRGCFRTFCFLSGFNRIGQRKHVSVSATRQVRGPAAIISGGRGLLMGSSRNHFTQQFEQNVWTNRDTVVSRYFTIMCLHFIMRSHKFDTIVMKRKIHWKPWILLPM